MRKIANIALYRHECASCGKYIDIGERYYTGKHHFLDRNVVFCEECNLYFQGLEGVREEQIINLENQPLISFTEVLNLSPREFETFIARHILPQLGYVTINLTPQTSDSGFDISAFQETNLILFECKRYAVSNKVGVRAVRNLTDACLRKNAVKGVFITTSDFTKTVFKEQRMRSLEIEFWNGFKLKQILENLNLKKIFCEDCGTLLQEKAHRIGSLEEYHYYLCPDCLGQRKNRAEERNKERCCRRCQRLFEMNGTDIKLISDTKVSDREYNRYRYMRQLTECPDCEAQRKEESKLRQEKIKTRRKEEREFIKKQKRRQDLEEILGVIIEILGVIIIIIFSIIMFISQYFL